MPVTGTFRYDPSLLFPIEQPGIALAQIAAEVSVNEGDYQFVNDDGAMLIPASGYPFIITLWGPASSGFHRNMPEIFIDYDDVYMNFWFNGRITVAFVGGSARNSLTQESFEPDIGFDLVNFKRVPDLPQPPRCLRWQSWDWFWSAGLAPDGSLEQKTIFLLKAIWNPK